MSTATNKGFLFPDPRSAQAIQGLNIRCNEDSIGCKCRHQVGQVVIYHQSNIPAMPILLAVGRAQNACPFVGPPSCIMAFGYSAATIEDSYGVTNNA